MADALVLRPADLSRADSSSTKKRGLKKEGLD